MNIEKSVLSLDHVLKTACNCKQEGVNVPKSRTAMTQAIGVGIDVMVAFVFPFNNKLYLSAGLSSVLKVKKIQARDWIKEAAVSVTSQITLKLEKSQAYPILLLEVKDHDPESYLPTLINELDQWCSFNRPLTIGVDIYSMPGGPSVPALEVLNTVLSSKHMNFIFYNKGLRDIEFLNISSTPNSHKESNCPLGYLPKGDLTNFLINSMIELRLLLEQADQENAKLYSSLLEGLASPSGAVSSRALYEIKNGGMNVFDNSLQRFIFHTEVEYRMGFSLENGGSYVPYLPELNRFQCSQKYILVTNDTRLMLNGELLTKIAKIDLHPKKLPNIKWMQGVPGCGKTRFILKHHIPGKDLVLTQTRAAIKDMRELLLRKSEAELGTPDIKFSESKASGSVSRLLKDYRTVSSFIINGSDRTYNRVFVDEALLMHAGYLGFISQMAGASEVLVFGDQKQIPYIERSRIKSEWSKLSDHMKPTETFTETHRCPIDVCYALQEHYPNFKTSNQQVISFEPISRENEFHQIKKDTLILTFTQAEKLMVSRALEGRMPPGRYKIHTVHEAQGLTSERVLLVRCNSKNLRIYDSEPHVIVALTRHTASFKYITVGEDDLVEKLIKKARLLNVNQLEQWNSKQTNNHA